MMSCETNSRCSSHSGIPVWRLATACAAASGERQRPRALPTKRTTQCLPAFVSRTTLVGVWGGVSRLSRRAATIVPVPLDNSQRVLRGQRERAQHALDGVAQPRPLVALGGEPPALLRGAFGPVEIALIHPGRPLGESV